MVDLDEHGTSIFVPSRLMESCEDDAELALEVIEDFRKSIQIRLVHLASAVALNDCHHVRFEAHAIKGSSRTIGADALAALVTRVEAAGAGGDLYGVSVLLAEINQQSHRLDHALTTYVSNQSVGFTTL
jgi:chemotaxis protein histidine kinase CheA